MDNQDLLAVLNDVIKFLEKLCEINLPNSFDDIRLNLLERSKKLINFEQTNSQEPYLEMNVGKGFDMFKNDLVKDNQSIYSDAEDLSKVSTDEYEILQQSLSLSSGRKSEICDDNEKSLLMMYNNYTAEKAKKKCIKFSPLYKKEERKLFGIQLFDHFRENLAGIIGYHLLIYHLKHDQQPLEVISIEGYSARPAPTIAIKDIERKISAFEIFAPGNKTFQFIARNPEEMEEWILEICRAGAATKTNSNLPVDLTTSNELLSNVGYIDSVKRNDEYENTGVDNVMFRKDDPASQSQEPKISSTDKNNFSSINSTSPLNLPNRINRRLPSLPINQQVIIPIVANDITPDQDADDIYYRIEEINSYQNFNKKDSMKNSGNGNKNLDDKNILENYDDINSKNNDCDDNKIAKNKNKAPKKKTFFNKIKRIKSNKSEAKNKSKQKNSVKSKDDRMSEELISQNGSETISYDDISPISVETSVKSKQTVSCNDKESIARNSIDGDLEEYVSPPPPRPVFNQKSSSDVETEEIYDDIGELGLNGKLIYENSFVESTALKDKQSESISNLSSKIKTKSCQEEMEHYQVPRPQSCIINSISPIEKDPEQTYDDIAISTVTDKTKSKISKTPSSPEKTSTYTFKTWNRLIKPKESILIKTKEFNV